ncbi:hypothetical protein M0813_17051 [Anaeramoeba flamelloides]|uniref:Uncharacterized protein n=1 Tax=Anaeramoeba flamelloides TaxID=1746091 RepID=A0ABQ8YYY7_9EUKA|nr:hypothetical protein M0813_17051 [Anaeramoeba flamelloides]
MSNFQNTKVLEGFDETKSKRNKYDSYKTKSGEKKLVRRIRNTEGEIFLHFKVNGITQKLTVTKPVTEEKIRNLFGSTNEKPITLTKLTKFYTNLGHYIATFPFLIRKKNQQKIDDQCNYLVNSMSNNEIKQWILLKEGNQNDKRCNYDQLFQEMSEKKKTTKLNTKGLGFIYLKKGVIIGNSYTLPELVEVVRNKFSLRNPIMKFEYLTSPLTYIEYLVNEEIYLKKLNKRHQQREEEKKRIKKERKKKKEKRKRRKKEEEKN